MLNQRKEGCQRGSRFEPLTVIWIAKMSRFDVKVPVSLEPLLHSCAALVREALLVAVLKLLRLLNPNWLFAASCYFMESCTINCHGVRSKVLNNQKRLLNHLSHNLLPLFGLAFRLKPKAYQWPFCFNAFTPTQPLAHRRTHPHRRIHPHRSTHPPAKLKNCRN